MVASFDENLNCFFVNFIRSVKDGPANGENRKDKKTNIDPVVPPWGQVGLYNLKRQSLILLRKEYR